MVENDKKYLFRI